jgi:hypothetical protein
MKSSIQVTLLIIAAAVTGCSQQPSTAPSGPETAGSVMTTFNTHCPILRGEVTADGGHVEWDGKTIGFCCPGCSDKFEALSDDEKTKALAESDEKHEGHDHDDGDSADAA